MGFGNYFYQLILFLLAHKTHWTHCTLGVMAGLISAEVLKGFPGLASAQCVIYRYRLLCIITGERVVVLPPCLRCIDGLFRPFLNLVAIASGNNEASIYW